MKPLTLVIVTAVTCLSAEILAQDFARLVRNRETITLTAFGPWPVRDAIQKLTEAFGVIINLEDGLSLFPDDRQPGTVLPKRAFIEIDLSLRSDGSLRDLGDALQHLVEALQAQTALPRRRVDFQVKPTGW